MSTKKRQELEARLDGRQRKAALMCVQREFAPQDERMTFDQIAAEVGVSRQSLLKWRQQNRAFIEYVNYLADDFLAAERAFVYRQLMKSISGEQPSIKGIDLYFKRHGLITERSVVETVEGGGRDAGDIAADIEALDALLDEDSGQDGGA